ncbi:hypothetical protein I547_5653 [Mycobacterium kansasii 824]|uniref:Uncharacterized protein n=1 Tax=Mycobacterium kansasii TaxID=1768 RepID=A0A1V3XDY5_MYCKA|nr:hypothetical protein I547_5653 [Mycobacterium kansasii 824]OOK74156.1 hypothetical protein BZL30_4837 [Mycobacterium kansasii]OOK77300.1 hypothetical protein BZL29_3920 [Mycobacterium kansasii]
MSILCNVPSVVWCQMLPSSLWEGARVIVLARSALFSQW